MECWLCAFCLEWMTWGGGGAGESESRGEDGPWLPRGATGWSEGCPGFTRRGGRRLYQCVLALVQQGQECGGRPGRSAEGQRIVMSSVHAVCAQYFHFLLFCRSCGFWILLRLLLLSPLPIQNGAADSKLRICVGKTAGCEDPADHKQVGRPIHSFPSVLSACLPFSSSFSCPFPPPSPHCFVLLFPAQSGRDHDPGLQHPASGDGTRSP